MIHIFFIFILLCLNERATITLQVPGIISNKSVLSEEYGTIKFDCLIEQGILAAWRINLGQDDLYRYYYTNPNLRNQFLSSDEDDEKPRDVFFENNRHTMVFVNVRQWLNSAFESLECLLYNNQTNRFQRRMFYLNVYVPPSAFSLNVNDRPRQDQSIFSFEQNEEVQIFCEIYSYPKSTLQFSWNNQPLSSTESIDCYTDDLSPILLSNSQCLSQTNWRIRVRISTRISLSTEHDEQNFTCSIAHFPYGNSWKDSIRVQFLDAKEKSLELGTSAISTFTYSSENRIAEPITSTELMNKNQSSSDFSLAIDSLFLTLLTTQIITTSKPSETLLLRESLVFIIILISLSLILLLYYIYRQKQKKVLQITNSIIPIE